MAHPLSRRAGASLVLALLLATTRRGVADPAAAALERGQIESEHVLAGSKAHEDLEYARCVAELTLALGESLTRVEKVATHRTLAFCHVALDQAEAAQADFVELLRLEPRFELERTISPRVRDVFSRAKATMPATTAPAPSEAAPPIVVTLAPEATPEQPHLGDVTTIAFARPAGATLASLFFRASGTAPFSSVRGAPKGSRFRLQVPGVSVTAPGVEYYVVAVDERGQELGRAGDEERPLVIAVDPQPRRGGPARIAAGVVGGVFGAGAVAGIVAAVVLLRPVSVTLMPR